MDWLSKIVDSVIAEHPSGEITVSSGVSPSGKYHIGTLREVLTAEAIAREIERRGRRARHVHVVDDLDVLRKVPAGVPSTHEKYFGMPLANVPAPDGSTKSYADYYLQDLLTAAEKLQLKMEVIRAHERYRAGFFVPAIEKALSQADSIKTILEDVSGRKIGEEWSPVQIMEDGYLKTRRFVRLDPEKHRLYYLDHAGSERSVTYADGKVKLSWRVDWPARWWLLNVHVEPFGRDHATKGGSYDTGKVIAEKVFGIKAPIPVPYHFINRAGETKKMSKSAGNTITAAELLDILPSELIWFFILRYPPQKQLFFNEGMGLMRLFDEFAELLAKPRKTEAEERMIAFCLQDVKQPTVSNVPFSHLVASYQAALRDPAKTLDIIRRTEHAATADKQARIIKEELRFIDNWLQRWAPAEVTFELAKDAVPRNLTDQEKDFLQKLAQKIKTAPPNADGEWFHKAIYDLKDEVGLEPKALFAALYQTLIGKDSGPRAGWFLSILPRDWLIERLRLET